MSAQCAAAVESGRSGSLVCTGNNINDDVTLMCTGIDGVERSFQSWIVSRTQQDARRRNRHRPGSSTNRYAGVRIDGLERGLRFLGLRVLLDAVWLRQRERDRADGEK